MGINRIKTGLPITLGGGEPTIHPGFYEIVNGIETKVDLLTNGMAFDLEEFVANTKPEQFVNNPERAHYKSIRMSYHPKSTDPDVLVSRARYLQNKGYSIGIFGTNHPESLSYNVTMTEKCRGAGVYFFVRDFLGYYGDTLYGYYKYREALNGNRKTVKCRGEEFLVAPDGLVYRCHRDLYVGEGHIGNILDISYEVTNEFTTCHNYGLCNPCDVKLKLGPDLVTSKSNVEII